MVIKSDSFSDEDFSPLRKASTYREFIRIYLNLFDYSIADFARATGFGRGFPSDVIAGKRRLTAKSGHAFEKALKLPLPGKKLFRLLIALEESDFHPDIDRASLPQEIKRLRKYPWKKLHTEKAEAALDFNHKRLAKKAQIVYAATGDFVIGATFKEIQFRTGFSENEIMNLSSELEKLNLIEVKDSVRVVPKDLHLFLKTCNQSQLLIQSFQESAELAAKRVPLIKTDSDEFFFSSSFCIEEAKLAQMKVELREIILKYIDGSIEASGDKVVNLILGLHL